VEGAALPGAAMPGGRCCLPPPGQSLGGCLSPPPHPSGGKQTPDLGSPGKDKAEDQFTPFFFYFLLIQFVLSCSLNICKKEISIFVEEKRKLKCKEKIGNLKSEVEGFFHFLILFLFQTLLEKNVLFFF
jgi:hypothetical protein